jgi:hypothetical protein
MVIRKGNNMKKTTISITAILILFWITANLSAGMFPPGYFLWVQGEFEIPDEIQKVTNVSDLKPFLDSKDTLTYSAAIRRLGEIEGPKAIGNLKGYLVKGTTSLEVGFIPVKKLEAIRTLGRIGTEQAKDVLLDTLKLYWEKGPILWESRNGNKGYYDSDDKDFTYTVPELLKVLYKWSSDNQVYEYVKTIAESNDVEKYYGTIGIKAWEIFLNGEMIRKGIINDREATIYWLDFENDIAKYGKYASVEKGVLKMNAVREILNDRISENIMNSLIAELKREQEKEPRDKGLTVRYLELRDKIDNLESYIKSKKEAQAKLEAYKKQLAERR